MCFLSFFSFKKRSQIFHRLSIDNYHHSMYNHYYNEIITIND